MKRGRVEGAIDGRSRRLPLAFPVRVNVAEECSMSASACIAFYGLRFDIRPDEIAALESRSDPRMVAARKAGLKHYWGNFGAPGEHYFLFVGYQLGTLGPENSPEVAESYEGLINIME